MAFGSGSEDFILGMGADIGSFSGDMGKANSSVDDFGDHVDDAGKKGDSFIGKITGMINPLTLMTGAVVGIGAAAITAWTDFDKGADAILAKTGATGTALDEMSQSVLNLKGGTAGLGTDMETIGNVIGEVNVRTGATGKTLEDFSGKIVNMSKITGGDAVTAVEDVTRVMGAWNVPMDEGSGLLDKLFTATQTYGVEVDSLTGSLTKFGPTLQEMGFSIDESIAMLGGFEKAGVNSDVVMAGLKKSVGEFAKQNVPLAQGLDDVTKKILGASSQTEALNIAAGVFGAKAAPDMVAAIQSGNFEFGEAAKKISEATGSIDDVTNRSMDFGDRWEMFTNQATVGLVAVGQGIMDLADGALATIGPIIEGVASAFEDVATALSGPLTEAWGVVSTFFSENSTALMIGVGAAITAWVIPAAIGLGATLMTTVVPALVATAAGVIAATWPFIAIGAAVALLWTAFENNFLGIRDLVIPVVDAIVQAVSRWWTEVQPQAVAAWNAISSTAVNAWNWIQSTIVAGVLALVDGWNSNWGGMQTIITSAWDTISAIVSTAWTLVSGIISAGLTLLSGDWEGAWEGVQTTLSDAWDIITTDLLPNALEMIGTLLFDFLPKLAGILLEWAGAFFTWVYTDILPQLPGWLGSIASALWEWLSTTAVDLGDKLWNEWLPALWEWITGPGGAVETIGSKVGEIASKVWEWITTAAGELSSKLINEWIPSFWNWITGEDGVVANIGAKLAEVWTAITDWIGTTASDILEAVVDIGANIVQGIWDGVSGAWQGFVDWLSGMVKDNLPQFIKDWLGISSPSQVMADIFQYVPLGMQEGVERTWGDFLTDMDKKMRELTDADGVIQGSLKKLADDDVLPIVKKLCDEDIKAPFVKLTDEDMPPVLGRMTEMVRQFCDEDLPAAAGNAGTAADQVSGAWASAALDFISDADAMVAAYHRLQDELANGVTVGNVTVYNGSNGYTDPVNSSGSNLGSGGGGAGGGRALGATSAGGGGWAGNGQGSMQPRITIIINGHAYDIETRSQDLQTFAELTIPREAFA